MTRLRKLTLVIAVCAAAALAAGCGDDNSGGDGTTIKVETIGRGASCAERLRLVATLDFLQRSGLGIGEPQSATRVLEQAIRVVCRQGPPGLSTTAAARRVVQVIQQSAAQQQGAN